MLRERPAGHRRFMCTQLFTVNSNASMYIHIPLIFNLLWNNAIHVPPNLDCSIIIVNIADSPQCAGEKFSFVVIIMVIFRKFCATRHISKKTAGHSDRELAFPGTIRHNCSRKHT